MPFASLASALLLALSSAPAAHAAPALEAGRCPPVAQMPSADEITALGAAARDHGFLWRITKEGHVSYLYGTLHAARREWLVPGPLVRAALTESDTLALELDVADPAIVSQLAEGMRAEADAAALPHALQARLQQRAEAECLPPASLQGLLPEMQVSLLTSLVGRREGLEPAFGIDGVLSGIGHATGKRVVSLETPALQIATLKMGSDAEMLAFVDNALADLESGRAAPALRRLAQTWADADLDALGDYERWCECQHNDFDRAEMQRLVDDRNPAMAAAVEALHHEGHRVFVAVGSLHMVGPQGLPALMAARGYRVERMNPTAPSMSQPR